jgi:hypothetical protein
MSETEKPPVQKRARTINIIRGKPTKGFTTLSNDVLNDARIAPDELGFLAWVLSLPPEWEIRPDVCRRRFSIGRDKLYRILKGLRRAGYAALCRVREQGSIVGVRYVIVGDPGEIDAMAPDLEIVPPDEEAPTEESPETENPDTEKPYPENPDTVVKNDSSERNDSPLPPAGENSQGPAPDIPTFEQFCERYRLEPWMSKSKAERRWHRLTDAEKLQAFEKIDPFDAEWRKRGFKKRKSAEEYLSGRHWEAFIGKQKSQPVAIKAYSAQWYRWKEYREATGKSTAFMLAQAKNGSGFWTEMSEWPPPIPSKESAA